MDRQTIRPIWMRAARLFCAAALGFLAQSSLAAAECRPETFEGSAYTVCSFDLTTSELRLFWRDAAGAPFRTFGRLRDELVRRGEVLTFAMNGGMYADDLSPIGLYIEGGKEIRPANTASVRQKPEPNFYKKPNGVFYLDEDEAGVMETGAFLNVRPETEFATQSGPMLVIDGAIHPAFIPGSSDRKPRNGVGVSSPTEVHFVISEDWVNFHDFARFFRNRLGCPDALFLDGGTAPGLYAPELRRDDAPGHGGYGPIIAAVE